MKRGCAFFLQFGLFSRGESVRWVGRDQALAEARRKSRYLAAYIRPTLAEASKYPKTIELLAITGFVLMAIWGIGVLIYYSVRDRR